MFSGISSLSGKLRKVPLNEAESKTSHENLLG
jgi:hypothetical protein